MVRYSPLVQAVMVRFRRMQLLINQLTTKKPLLASDVAAVLGVAEADLAFITRELPSLAQKTAMARKGGPLAPDESFELTELMRRAVERLTNYYMALRMSISPLQTQIEKGHDTSRIIEILRRTFYVGRTLHDTWMEHQKLIVELQEADGLIAALTQNAS